MFDKVAHSAYLLVSPNIQRGEPGYWGAKGIIHETCYINRTASDVVVSLRNGLRWSVAKIAINEKDPTTRHYRDFIIRNTYRADKSTFPALQSYLLSHDALTAPSEEFELFKKAFLAQLTGPEIQHIVVHMDYVIKREELNERPHLYVSICDTMLSTTSIVNAEPHPYSTEALMKAGISSMADQYFKDTDIQSGLGVVIELIDNDNSIGSRYMYFGQTTHTLRPTTSLAKTQGVHFTVIDPSKTTPVSSTHMAFGEAEEVLGLYRDKETARIKGDHEGAKKQEIAELTHQANVSKLALQRQQQEAQEKEFEFLRDKQAQDAEILRLQTELHRLRISADHEKVLREDYYDRRSHARRDSTELIKFIPSLIAAGLAIYIGITKFSGNK